MPKFKDRVGETKVMNNGLKATIIAYRNVRDIDVQFEDGTIINNRIYYQFQRREIAHPQDRDNFVNSKVGETNLMSNGLKATIITYRNRNDIDVQFEDGVVVEHRAYRSFFNGHIAHSLKDRTGETKVMHNGLKATIVAYRKANDIDVRFEDGIVIEHRTTSSFTCGNIAHPLFSNSSSRNFYGYKLSKPLKINEDMIIYRAENLETRERELLTPQQILERTKNKELEENVREEVDREI